ncbi:MAG: FAD-dependent oxidoreductase, partial [Henriciella sp.]|uniref:phytoene desaturase family protein n=1 Tax=Henriciella sp. TaxID=1968823 RepID=UPI003C73E90B
MRPRIVIIGAGIAGLTAAAILSRHADVTVAERASDPGGKIETRDIGGQPVDCGPTVLTLRSVFETIFREAGAVLDDHLTLNPADELARHFWSGGAALDLYSDLDRSYEAVAQFSSRGEAEKYLAFSNMAGRVFETLSSSFMLAPEPDFFKLLTSRSAVQLLGLNPFESLWQVLSKQFDDPRLIQLFARYATYCGASPFLCPGTLMLVAHVERLGVWKIPGGLTLLAQALARLAEENGASFEYGAHVEEVEFTAGKPSGVRLAGGRRIAAKAVICNGDVAALAGGEFGRNAARALPSRSDTRSQSAMTWTFAAGQDGPALSHHNVFFSDDYKAEFDAVFDERAVPGDPTVYLCAPDSGGPQPYFSLINAPADGDTHTYSDEETAQCHARMTRRLQS